jgi:hypothetical protein
VKIERVAFEEIPTEIQVIAKNTLKGDVEFFEATVYHYDDIKKDYIIRGVDDISIIEVSVNSKRGLQRVDMVSFSTVSQAIKKFPNIAERFRRVLSS